MTDSVDHDGVRQQIAQHRETLRTRSTKAPEHAVGLTAVEGREVQVYVAPKGLIQHLAQRPGNGAVMRDEDTYLIFIDEAGDQEIRAALGGWDHRFLVLHEYAHVLHGDLPEDNIDVIKRTDEQGQFAERCANGYAAARLAIELDRSNQSDLSTLLSAQIKSANWVAPHHNDYAQAFPQLNHDPDLW